jgi:hypothetical protein
MVDTEKDKTKSFYTYTSIRHSYRQWGRREKGKRERRMVKGGREIDNSEKEICIFSLV